MIFTFLLFSGPKEMMKSFGEIFKGESIIPEYEIIRLGGVFRKFTRKVVQFVLSLIGEKRTSVLLNYSKELSVYEY